MPPVVAPSTRPVTTAPVATPSTTKPAATATATPPATRGGLDTVLERASGAARHYLSKPANVASLSLTAVRSGLNGAALLGRGLPLVGNVLNAVSAILDAAKACVHTGALLDKDPSVDTASVVADWARVATDIAGVFFPPIGVAGSVGNTAYAVYDAVQKSRDAGGH